MSSPQRPQYTGLSLATSANGSARNGASLPVDFTAPGALLVLAYSTITTASVVATFKMQASNDGTTWYDVKLVNNASNVDTAAGTGVAVETFLALDVPTSVYAAKLFRVVATLSGAATAAADKTSVTYQYVPQGKLVGL